MLSMFVCGLSLSQNATRSSKLKIIFDTHTQICLHFVRIFTWVTFSKNLTMEVFSLEYGLHGEVFDKNVT